MRAKRLPGSREAWADWVFMVPFSLNSRSESQKPRAPGFRDHFSQNSHFLEPRAESLEPKRILWSPLLLIHAPKAEIQKPRAASLKDLWPPFTKNPNRFNGRACSVPLCHLCGSVVAFTIPGVGSRGVKMKEIENEIRAMRPRDRSNRLRT